MPFVCQCQDALLVGAEGQSLKQCTLHLSLQLPHHPSFLDALLEIELHFHGVVTFENLKIMAPCQLVRHCLTFWERKIELSHIKKIGAAKSSTVSQCQVFCEVNEQLFAIFCTRLTSLLILYDVLPCLPVGFEQLGVDSTDRALFGLTPKCRDIMNQLLGSWLIGWEILLSSIFMAANKLYRCEFTNYLWKFMGNSWKFVSKRQSESEACRLFLLWTWIATNWP